jgi:3-hydroxyisobutyrate dehydrogenase-like beta-hydroxyacid dehydrogenase
MTTRTVGIAGGGNMARATARRLAAAGHRVQIFDRDPESAAKVAAEQQLAGRDRRPLTAPTRSLPPT